MCSNNFSWGGGHSTLSSTVLTPGRSHRPLNHLPSEVKMYPPSFLYKILKYLNLVVCFFFFLPVSFGWCIKKEGLHRQLSGKESTCQYRRPGFDPWVGKIPWMRTWPLTPVILPEKSQGQGSLADNSPWCLKETDMITKHVSSQEQLRDLPTQFGSSLESLLSHRLSTF